jgi:SAM-dependent methyltransferase
VLHGQLESTELSGRRFDVVRLWHVFEHLHDPRAGLGRIGELLAPGGELVLGVPAIDSLAARCFGRHWGALDAPRHLYQFDRRTIVGLLESCGYRVLAIRRIDARTGFSSMQQLWESAVARASGGRWAAPRLFDHPLVVKLCRPLELPVNLLGLGDALVIHATRDEAAHG